MTLDWHYLVGLAGMVLRHPSALLEMRKGFEAVGERLQELIGEDYLRHPTGSLRTRGFTIYLDPKDAFISGQIGIRHVLEPEVITAFEEALSNAKVVVDAGANIGWYTLLSARRLLGIGTVLAFEPEPARFSYLIKSVNENGFTNVRLFNLALSSSSGEAVLHFSPDVRNPGLHSIVHEYPNERQNVRTTTLDEVANASDFTAIDILKLDVEGAEPLILNGAKELLARRRIKDIFMEWNPDSWRNESRLLEQLESMYNTHELKWGRTIPVLALASLQNRGNLHLSLRR